MFLLTSVLLFILIHVRASSHSDLLLSNLDCLYLFHNLYLFYHSKDKRFFRNYKLLLKLSASSLLQKDLIVTKRLLTVARTSHLRESGLNVTYGLVIERNCLLIRLQLLNSTDIDHSESSFLHIIYR